MGGGEPGADGACAGGLAAGQGRGPARLPARTRGLLLVSLAALLWSTGGLAIKGLSVDAITISFFRCTIAGFTILLLQRLRGRPAGITFDSTSLLASAAFAPTLLLFVIGMKLTDAANVVFLQYLAPVYLLALEPLVLKVPFDRRSLPALLVCLAGMALFFAGKMGPGRLAGNLLGAGSGVTFAILALALKRRKSPSGQDQALGPIIVGCFLVGLISLPGARLHVTLPQLAGLVYLGVFQIGLAYFAFGAGIRLVSATQALIIGMLETVFTPIWVYLGLREVPTPYAIAGAVLILGAVLWRSLLADGGARG